MPDKHQHFKSITALLIGFQGELSPEISLFQSKRPQLYSLLTLYRDQLYKAQIASEQMLSEPIRVVIEESLIMTTRYLTELSQWPKVELDRETENESDQVVQMLFDQLETITEYLKVLAILY